MYHKFSPAKGGHAPGYLRDAFHEYLETEQVVIDEVERPIKWLIGQLWNCTDIMPSEYCSLLDIPSGSTYAQAVRFALDTI
ncbi:MAG: hypothetical protein JSV96_13205 [Candidatus Aminicenantes bacterium]|nr:MAG: hypothetical protein JSV96_13205 [Candidatus Aminicenantes bacterium]